MDEHQTRVEFNVVAIIEALSFREHEREEFDEYGRLIERLRYNDDGNLYCWEYVAYPGSYKACYDDARRLVELVSLGINELDVPHRFE